MSRPPIFIIGNSRSGTTMLRLMLTCHPEICIPPEGPFATLLLPKYAGVTNWTPEVRAEFFEAVNSIQKMENWNLDNDEARSEFRNGNSANYGQAVAQIYDLYRSRNDPQAKRWGDKSGNVSLKLLKGLCEQLGEFRIIHIVRDGRDVLCSYRGTSGITHQYAPNLSSCPIEVGREWSNRVLALDSLAQSLGRARSLSVRYEDLVNSPHDELERICRFLGEDFEKRMTRFGEENSRRELEPASFLQWKSKTTEPLSNSQVGRWKRELTQQDVADFELVAAPGMKKFGYARTVSRPSLGSWLRVSRNQLEYQLRRVAKRMKG